MFTNKNFDNQNSINTDAIYIFRKQFRYIPWTTCGYTFNASGTGNTFGGAITATTTAPTPTTGSTTTYIYCIVGNTMYLQFTYINPTATTNVAGVGNGVYFYNLPAGYTIDTSLIQTVTPGSSSTANQNAYGPNLGYAALDWFVPFTNKVTCLGVSVYATSTTSVSIFIPSAVENGALSVNSFMWHGSTFFGYQPGYNRYTFTCSFPIV